MRVRYLTRVLFGAVLTAGASLATPAMAIDLQIYGGGSTAAVGSASGGTVAVSGASAGDSLTMSSRLTGSQFGGSLMFHPFWPLPVAVGAFALQQELKGDQTGMTEDFKGTQFGPEALLWVPIPIIQPYVRGGYDASGNYTYTATTQAGAKASVTGAVRGYHGAAGLRLSLIGPFGVFLETDYARSTDVAPELVMQSHAFVAGFGGHL